MAVLTRKDGNVFAYNMAHEDKRHRLLLMSDVH